jgi:hypothetical protein
MRAGALVLAALLLLGAAFVNGYPLVFYDTGDYIAMSFTYEPIIYRTIPYALFLRATHWGLTLWLPVIAQALIAAWVIGVFLASMGLRGLFVLPAAILLLVLLTPLPWFAGQLMPDIFAGVAVLALIALALGEGISPRRRWLLLAVVVAGGAVHLTHMAVLAGLFLCFVAARVLRQQVRLLLPALAVALSLAVPPLANAVLTGRAYYSEAGPVFLFARLVQDGIAQDYLNEACLEQEHRYDFCAWRGVLPKTANDLLWAHDSVVASMGGWHRVKGDAGRVVADSLVAMPWRHLTAAFANLVEQFVSFRAGEGLDVNQWEDSRTMVWQYFPADAPAYRDSLQQATRLRFDALNAVYVLVGGAALLLLLPAIALAWRRQRRVALACAFILLALLGNAAICGILSNPAHRYQSRIVWLAPLAAALALLSRRSGQNTIRRSSAVGTGTQSAV